MGKCARNTLVPGMRIFRKSIGATLFGAFIAMSLIVAVQGYYGYSVLNTAGDMVVDTFDRPLMAVNYARAAHFDFAQIENRLLERARAAPGDRARLDAQIDELAATFGDDLGVAEDRSDEADELKEIEAIKSLMKTWVAAHRAGDFAGMDAIGAKIDGAFDLLIEFNTDHSYVGRRKAVDAIAQFRYVLVGGLLGSILLAILITLALTRRIARPLSQAASVADRIARGEFETAIPPGGQDETGTLLRSMTVMQDGIRAMMARETARAASAEVRLTDALETSDEGVMLVGADGKVAIVNSKLKTFFPDVAGIAPGASFDALAGLFGGGDAPSHELRLPDGRWVRITVSPTSDSGRIVFVSDFTDIKAREQSYKQAKKDAEAASAAKSRFLANMSHELRTPLNAIIGFSEILSGQIFGVLGSPRYVEYATDIMHSGRHLLDVINSVLDLSKSEAGKMELKAQPVDLADVLKDCARMVADQCTAAGLTLEVSGADRELPVAGEIAKLRQIFLNLLSNAIKFTETGGTVSLIAHDDGHAIAATVDDSGIGMSPQDVQVALTPFGQVDSRLERKYEGTGLGLPLAKSLVELHGGSLQIESDVGCGTRITVRLTRASLAEAAA
jgi:signal transduction histidine kinase/HAMP domain-containing protein